MATSDPLFFLAEQPVSNNTAGQNPTPATINPVAFILNVIFVLVILYITLLLIRLVYRKTGTSNPHLLKEVPLGQSGKLQYIKVGEKMYLLANNGTQWVHLDTITDPQTILELLNEIKPPPETPAPFSWRTIPRWIKRNRSVEIEPAQFDDTLKKIIRNSNKLENLNNR
jgi:flagellar biogenesis protein FliO